jgi:hypothetical protein
VGKARLDIVYQKINITIDMSDVSSALSSPASTNSTLPSSVPSPDLKALKLDGCVVTEQAKAEAAELKARANKAFASAWPLSTVHNEPI